MAKTSQTGFDRSVFNVSEYSPWFAFQSVAFVLFLLFVSPVASGEEWSVPSQRRTEEQRFVFDPAIGHQASRRVGESLVNSWIHRVKKSTFWKVTLRESVSERMGLLANFRLVSASANTSGQLLHYSIQYNPMLCVSPSGRVTINISEMAGCFVDTDKDGSFDSIAFPGYPVDRRLLAPVGYDLQEDFNVEEFDELPRYRVEIVYLGLSQGEAKVSFREFRVNMAKPIVVQGIAFKLKPDESGVFVYRGIRIHVTRATQENIYYRILEFDIGQNDRV